MKDQAEGLRGGSTPFALAIPARHPEDEGAIVIGSGKGGVGKSTLSVLFAAALARRGLRTLLLDGSQNQGNLHILLGVRPAAPLASLWSGDVSARDLLVPVEERLDLLPADSGAESLYALGSVDRARLHHRLSSLYDGYDRVIVDGGPGFESVMRVAGIRASRLLVVATPEPAALADTYALLKITSLQLPSLPLEVMANQVRADEEGWAVQERLGLAVQRFLGRELGYVGGIREDDAVRHAARQPGALRTLQHPDVEALADKLAGAAAAGGTP